MAITPYASSQDLKDWLGPSAAQLPADVIRMLTRAQELVDAAMTSAMYGTDAAGENATDAKVITALKNAVCAQVEYWLVNGDEFDQMSQFSSFSIEGIAANRAGGTGWRNYRLCDRSWDALRAAKLVPGTVFST